MSEQDDSAHRCAICGHPMTRPQHVCQRCRDIVSRALHAIADLHARLDPARPAGKPGERVTGGGSEAPIPINIDAVDLAGPPRPAALTPQLWPQDQIGYPAVRDVLDQWAKHWHTHGAPGTRLPVPTVPNLTGWLNNRLDWACDNLPTIAEFHNATTALERTLRHVTGIDRDQTLVIGECRGRPGEPCGATLRATPWQDSAECKRCGTRWPRMQWLALRMLPTR